MRAAAAAALAALGLVGCAATGGVQEAAAPAVRVIDPPTPTPEPTPAASAVHRVAKGESLWRIARSRLGAGARFEELAALNHVAGPDYWIHPGDELSLPGGGAASPPPPQPRLKPRHAAKYGWVKKRNTAFTLGEKLVFAVKYFNVTAGYSMLEVTETVELQGRPCYHVVATAKTHPFFETFFKVRDRLDTFIDVDYIFSWSYEKHIREGGYSADAAYVVDQRAHFLREPSKGKDVPVPPDTQDPLSQFYAFRIMDLQVGKSAVIRVAADDFKNYEVKVDSLRKERVEVAAGVFDTVVVQPHLKFEGVFQNKGEVFIWISDDERRLPVQIKSQIAIGSIYIELQEAVWARPTQAPD